RGVQNVEANDRRPLRAPVGARRSDGAPGGTSRGPGYRTEQKRFQGPAAAPFLLPYIAARTLRSSIPPQPLFERPRSQPPAVSQAAPVKPFGLANAIQPLTACWISGTLASRRTIRELERPQMLLARLHGQQHVAAENFAQHGAAIAVSARSRRFFWEALSSIERFSPTNSAACEATSRNRDLPAGAADAARSNAKTATNGGRNRAAVKGTQANRRD